MSKQKMSTTEEIPLSDIEENEVDRNENDMADDNQRKISDSCSNPLMRSIRAGESFRSSLIKRTKSSNLDITEIDKYHRNVFHYAVSKPDTLQELLKIFKEQNTTVQEALHQVDKNGETPMHRAARFANIESVEILHEYDNTLVNLKTDVTGRSVLHLAVNAKSVVTVKFVLSKASYLVNCVDIMQQTPVHYAAKLKQSSIMELLISKGSDTTLTDRNTQLAVHVAASNGSKNNVRLLLRENPDFIDITDMSCQSPLLLAAKNDFPNVVSCLLAKNARYELTDKNDLTAFDWAVKNNLLGVVKVFLDTKVWKEVVSASQYGPEGCLTAMVENMPEMAKLLLDKCITTRGTKERPQEYQVKYDFFCLEEPDENKVPRFEALDSMVENECEICLRHPVAIKYVDVKWRKRGFKYSTVAIIVNLIIHLCLLIYATQVIGEVTDVVGKNTTKTSHVRKSLAPNHPGIMVLRVILLTIAFGALLKEMFRLKSQGLQYFTVLSHYWDVAMSISVAIFVLPVNEELSAMHAGGGAIAVLISWGTIIQYLTVVPVIGIYIIVVQRIFWTLMKIAVVVIIYLLSFSTTFYILLTEHRGFGDIIMSFITTFVAMTNGVDYEKYFLPTGWYKETYEIKMLGLIAFIVIITIVVNNALIGLAVGDTNDVMKCAKFDKFKRRAKFVIHLEKSVNNISCLKTKQDKVLVEYPGRKKNVAEKISALLYFGSKIDEVESDIQEDEHLNELDFNFEDHVEKTIEIKLDNLRSNLRHDLKEIQDNMKEELDEKVKMILENFK